jgi:hypothetical protein
MTTLTQWHVVMPADRERIRCSDCQGPTFACEHSHWNVNGMTGLSFFYYCLEHAVAHGFDGEVIHNA